MKTLIQRLRGTSGEADRVRLERLGRLQELTAALSAASTPAEVGAIIFDRGLGLVGARAVTLFWETSPGQLELVHGLGLSEEFVQRFARITTGAPVPGADAYRTGEPVWLASREEIVARFPAIADIVRQDRDLAWAAIPLVADRSRGALELRFDTRRVFNPEEREFVLTVARQCAQALERARLFEAQKRLAERVASLQAVTAALSAAPTPAEVAAIVFRGLLGLGAREAGIFYVSSEVLELGFAHGADADTRRLLSRIPLDVQSPLSDAVRAGAPLWLETPDIIRDAYPQLEAERARRGDGAWVVVPLVVDRRAVGVLGFTSAEPRSFGEDDRSFVMALAQQCSQALERARLYDTQKKLAERLAQVHSTAAALSGAATPHEVAELAFGALASALGARAAEIYVVSGPEELVLLARHGEDSGLEPPLTIDAPTPVAEVVRTGKAMWIESPDALEERFPSVAARARRAAGAWVAVPLLAAGKALGALSVAFAEPRPLDADERSFVRLVAQPCAQALERATLFEEAARSRLDAEREAAILDRTLAAAPVGVALLDPDMKFVRVNAALARLHGVPADAHVGRTPLEVLPGVAGEQLADAFRRAARTGERQEDEISGEIPAAAGLTRRWRVSVYPVRVANRLAGVGLVARDPT